MSKTRIGVIGAGRWGRVILRAAAGVAGIAVTGLASGNPNSAAQLPPGARAFADWRAMIAAGGLDGVVIATPPATHAAIATAAIEAGLGVFIEKPLTLNGAEAQALRDFAAHRQAVVRVDHIHLFSPAFRALKAQAANIRALRGVAGNWGPYRSDASVLWDWGPHDIAMALDLMGRLPTKIAARRLDRRDVEGGVGETLRLSLDFDGVAADIVIGTLMDKTRRFEVDSGGGTLSYDDLAADKLCWNGRPLACPATPPLSVALAEFGAAVATRDTALDQLDLGIRVVEVLERCQQDLD